MVLSLGNLENKNAEINEDSRDLTYKVLERNWVLMGVWLGTTCMILWQNSRWILFMSWKCECGWIERQWANLFRAGYFSTVSNNRLWYSCCSELLFRFKVRDQAKGVKKWRSVRKRVWISSKFKLPSLYSQSSILKWWYFFLSFYVGSV